MHKPRLATVEPTMLQWAQLAAFIDGEGHISIERGVRPKHHFGYTYCLYVGLCNTDPRLIQWCVTYFGGAFYRRNMEAMKSAGNRYAIFHWRLCNRSAERILVGCLPYFIIKKEQAELALAFRETFRGSKRIGLKRVAGKGPSNHLDHSVLHQREQFRQAMLVTRGAYKTEVSRVQ